jgi:hypothetical protein
MLGLFPASPIDRKTLKSALPGYIATALMILVTLLWTFWSVGEMYYEGWWGPWYSKLFYLIPCTVCLVLTLLAFAWPLIGGWAIILIGAAFTAWWWGPRVRDGMDIGQLLALFPVSAVLVIIGVLFLFEHRHRQRRRDAGWTPTTTWLRRHRRGPAGTGSSRGAAIPRGTTSRSGAYLRSGSMTSRVTRRPTHPRPTWRRLDCVAT